MTRQTSGFTTAVRRQDSGRGIAAVMVKQTSSQSKQQPQQQTPQFMDDIYFHQEPPLNLKLNGGSERSLLARGAILESILDSPSPIMTRKRSIVRQQSINK